MKNKILKKKMILNCIIVFLRLFFFDCYNLGEIVRVDNGFWF